MLGGGGGGSGEEKEGCDELHCLGALCLSTGEGVLLPSFCTERWNARANDLRCKGNTFQCR